ncbi:MAG: M56 family metallopeptidase, partial [Gemmiger sp.]
MRSLVLSFLQMSLWGGVAALGVLAVCAILRRCRAPSRFLCWLWLAAGTRFVLPGGIPVTLPRPRSERLAAAVGTVEELAAPVVSPTALPVVPVGPAAAPSAGLTVWHLAAGLWLAGVLVLLVRAVGGYLRLRRSVSTACKAPDGCFGGVPVPFTLGIVRPRIYLPDSLTGSARETVRRHEETHIRRGDTLTKPLFYAVACLHWFNPLAWLAFCQFERTMESACDDAAVRGRTARE